MTKLYPARLSRADGLITPPWRTGCS